MDTTNTACSYFLKENIYNLSHNNNIVQKTTQGVFETKFFYKIKVSNDISSINFFSFIQ